MAVLDARTIEIINHMTPGADTVGLGTLMEQALSGVLPPGSISLAEIAQGTDGQLIVGQTGSALLYKTLSGDATLTAGGVITIGTLAHAFTIGVDGTGYDVKFFGDTTGKYWLWDQSDDKMVILGHADITGNFVNNLTTSTYADFISADAGALGPVVRLWQNSASPAANDVCGRLLFQGEDNASMRVSYAQVDGVITNVATANPEGDLVLSAAYGGVMTEMLRLVGTSNSIKPSRPIYANLTGMSATALKIHSHLTTAETAIEFKGELINTSGTVDGLASHWSYSPTGTTGAPDAVRAAIANMTLTAANTMTAGWIAGIQASTIISGTLNGAAICEFGVLGVLAGDGTRTLVAHSAGVASVLHVAAGDEPATGELSNFFASSDFGGTIDNLMYIEDHATTTNFLNMTTAGNTGFVTTGGTDCATSNTTDPSFTLKCIMPGGAAGYIRVWAAA